jgi:DNA gyrase inhibitor GyrI
VTPISVRIEELKPMRVASVRVISANPEIDAWRTLKTWAESNHLLSDPDRYPVFGYTFQPPKKNETEYGYEFWIAIGPEIKVESDVKEQAFAGGLYAVTTHHGPPSPEVWKSLWDWVQTSRYRWRKTHELERPRNPSAPVDALVFDLYLPIETRT